VANGTSALTWRAECADVVIDRSAIACQLRDRAPLVRRRLGKFPSLRVSHAMWRWPELTDPRNFVDDAEHQTYVRRNEQIIAPTHRAFPPQRRLALGSFDRSGRRDIVLNLI